MNEPLLNILNTIVASATPLVIASLGETITERAGMINLSLNGSLLLAAMVGFAAAFTSQSLLVGFIAAMIVGALIALIIALGAIHLRQDQVALGFVLTLLCADLAQFLGTSYNNQPGPKISQLPIPLLQDIPVVGPVLFQQDITVYFSFLLTFAVWYLLFYTRQGLELRAVGERPETAFARGADVNWLRYFYTLLGGALVGFAGATYSLNIKAGWSSSPTMNGDGWIALAIVIFGGWHPFRVLLGAYLFAALRAVASAVQRDPNIQIPLVLLNTLPWLLMVGTLMLVSGGVIDRLLKLLPPRLQNVSRQFLRSAPPKALGTRFEGG